MPITKLTLRKKRHEGHVHGRDKATSMMQAVVPFTARQFHSAVWMPNTNPFITTPEIAAQYKSDLDKVTEPVHEGFRNIVVGYLQENTDPDLIETGFKGGYWHAMKCYPRGAQLTRTAAFVIGRKYTPVSNVWKKSACLYSSTAKSILLVMA